MIKSKTLVVILTVLLPGAFFGVVMAGNLCYNHEHVQMQRTHHANPEYLAVLYKYEGVGALLGAVPGVLVLLKSRYSICADYGNVNSDTV